MKLIITDTSNHKFAIRWGAEPCTFNIYGHRRGEPRDVQFTFCRLPPGASGRQALLSWADTTDNQAKTQQTRALFTGCG